MEIEVYLCACKTGQDCDLRVTEFEPSSLHAGERRQWGSADHQERGRISTSWGSLREEPGESPLAFPR